MALFLKARKGKCFTVSTPFCRSNIKEELVAFSSNRIACYVLMDTSTLTNKINKDARAVTN